MLVAQSKDFTKAMPVQYLGLVNGSNNGNTTNHIFAVELDTWQNPEFGDINNNHIGININGLTSVKSHPAGFFHDQNGTFKNLTLSSQEAMQVWVDYDREKTQIDVTMAPLDMATKPQQPTVSARYNLSVVLTDVAYIGFSSSTGRIDARHYVLGWSFAVNSPAPAFNLTMLPKLPRHHPKGRQSWVLEIIKGIASGLLYLHEEWEKVVVHRDIKASNVLLDDEMNGRLGDFGLARLYDHGIDPQTTHVVGTIGYLAPELARSGNATPPTDVFSFGMFVLEVICGQRPVNHQNTQDSQLMLVDWVIDNVQKESFCDAVDARLKGRFDVDLPPTCHLLSFSLQVTSMLAMKHTSFLQQFLLLFGLIIATLASGDDQFIFYGFNQSSLTLDGSGVVTESGLLDLSNGRSGLDGHAFYPTPLHFRKSLGGKVQSFSVNVVFSIFIMYPDLSADGMAFFIAPTKNFSDARAAKYFGVLNEKNNGNTSEHIFMIELDTYKNAEIQDIDDNHIGININSAVSSESTTAGFYEDEGGAFNNMTLNGNKAMQLWVDYDEGDTQINVTLAPINMGKPSRPLLSATYDLSTVLSDSAQYIGFSSVATPINTRDYVMGWSFGMNRPAPSIDISKLPKLPLVGPQAQSKLLEIILPVATATLILSMGTLVTLVMRRRIKYAEVREDWEGEFGPHRFSYKDLFHATGGFKNKHLLGEGGFGKVYKGCFHCLM
ncbi:hypothetical protein ZWY2020_018507 [Hordeum vulgare]|nr:hypothetical protein ZWY2020_018507 [Hordeum vulgare]